MSSEPPLARKLVRHPQSPGLGVMAIEVTVTRAADGGLMLDYAMIGAIAALRVPADKPPQREDGLWRHTCLEAFVRTPGAAEYREFNFAPSGAWQAYAFTAYREGGLLACDTAPLLTSTRSANRLDLKAYLPAALLPPGELRLALAAVVETPDGRLGYWALAHAAPKPDFHRAESFLVSLS